MFKYNFPDFSDFYGVETSGFYQFTGIKIEFSSTSFFFNMNMRRRMIIHLKEKPISLE